MTPYPSHNFRMTETYASLNKYKPPGMDCGRPFRGAMIFKNPYMVSSSSSDRLVRR